MIPKRATELAVHDQIVDGKHVTTVQTLSLCPCSVRGVRKVHVNDHLCYDSLAFLMVIPAPSKIRPEEEENSDADQ